ncbi:hypothetical protein [Paraferrimonas sedimenticola]|uniref:Diguanylate cyclase n=1 Tax=Paraferrimonas sedimenticola TaxID=375674 RepID=A0AA37RUP3_9GAMM|nr:hypothetical protein [Paraferrimonas sedimenticola]GLP95556.1 diguanylate cyclase [Paraferrimonas sedimenticola]
MGLLLFVCLSVIAIVCYGVVRLNNAQTQLEKRHWADHSFNQLQTVANMTSEEMGNQIRRTGFFASSSLLSNYLNYPNETNQERLQANWEYYTEQLASMQGLAFYDLNGNLELSTTNDFMPQKLEAKVINDSALLANQTFYTSEMQLHPIDGKDTPLFYLVNLMETTPGMDRGYFVHYISAEQVLGTAAPYLAQNNRPIVVLDEYGGLFYQRGSSAGLALPYNLGDQITEVAPELWQQMQGQAFGRIAGEEATYVYIKASLAGGIETNRHDYYLISYIRNDQIQAALTRHHNVVIGIGVILGLLAIALVITIFTLHNETATRKYSHKLAKRLFSVGSPILIVSKSQRVLYANDGARHLFGEQTRLEDSSLKSLLGFDEAQAQKLLKFDQQHNIGITMGQRQLSVNVECLAHRRMEDSSIELFILGLTDLSQVAQLERNNKRLHAQLDSAQMNLLVTPDGKIENANPAYESFLADYHLELPGNNLKTLLEQQQANFWQRLTNHCHSHKNFSARIQLSNEHNQSAALEVSAKGQWSKSDQLRYISVQMTVVANSIEPLPVNQLNDSQAALERQLERLSDEDSAGIQLMLFDVAPKTSTFENGEDELIQYLTQQIELDFPNTWQRWHWRPGQLMVLVPKGEAQEIYYRVRKVHLALSSLDSEHRISTAITGNPHLADADGLYRQLNIALRRAKQMSGMKICIAFSKQSAAV